jgi:hypothetical protein
MQWLGGKDAGWRVQIMDPPEEICSDFGDILQLIAILNGASNGHSAEEVEPIRETCAFAIQIWQHDCK